MSLKAKAATGIKWSSISRFTRQGLMTLTTIIMARLLTPSDFGLLGMAMVVIGFGALFRELGAEGALIQRKDTSEKLLSSVFWFNVLLGVATMALVYASAPLAAHFYHEPKVSRVIKALSLVFVISGSSAVHAAILTRNMEFRQMAALEIVSSVAGAAVGVVCALYGQGVWSLVYQSITIAAVSSISLWTASRWRPLFFFDRDELKTVWDYTLNLSGYTLFNYFARNADNFLIGRYCGSGNLGYYSVAYQIMFYPLQTISAVFGRVMFPVLSKLQTNNAGFKSAYIKMVSVIAVFTFPITFGMLAVADPLVTLLLGAKWEPAIWLILVLAPVGLIQSIGTTVGVIYKAKGRTGLMFKWGVFAGMLVILSFAIGLQWGVRGVAVCYALVSLALAYPNFAIPFRLIDMKVGDLSVALWRPFVCATGMFITVAGLKHLAFPAWSSVTLVSTLVPVGVVVYMGLSYLLNRENMHEIITSLR